MSGNAPLLRPDRIRTIEKPFGWIPFRMITDGTFADLSDRAKLLYFFLCLAADRQGTSFYGDARLQSYFELAPADVHLAREELIRKNLIAYDGRLYQVLSLPPLAHHPVPRRVRPTPDREAGEPELFADILTRLAK